VDNNHDELMKRHQNRRETNFVPYHERRSAGQLRYRDEGARVRVEMEVAGLGMLVLIAESRYCEVLKYYKWDQQAELKAQLQTSGGPPSLLRQVV
jgi:hypothetical protein